MTVPMTLLGDGLTVSRLGFGAMALTGVYGASTHGENLDALNHALDLGVTFIDTADIYGDGDSERTVGEVAKTRRGEMTIATKFGITGSIANKTMRARNDPAYVREAVDASLTRLGIDTIDLYYLHRREVSVPIEDTVGAMAELVAAGKVRHLGLSEVTADELEAAHRVHPMTAVQSEWSVWSRDVERAVAPTAARLGIGFVPYSPLGRGFLTGALSDPAVFAGDWRAGLTRFTGDAFAGNQTVVAALTGIAGDHEATPAQIALAWLYAAGDRLGVPVVPIPGTRRPERIAENAAAISIVLTADELHVLDDLSAQVRGERSDFDDPNWTSDTRERADT
ncbi:aldo/keto reductase [Microbacterium sp. SORGH_AS_0888]|uniref:aldo/keto reductase n=1 Tax=Microbacterium sp. SORGH_AS_0888 TaxID=3041791 RepID=UPI00277E7EDF|nr:aldo/keto reductase [Microbacterium sp. SORGH_AS_0888]MDQ1128978.1 aryl-alcohol dehydrogenase-like predicted oxidoreductase [Microbacterium sp. SORGH_AS_0888]